MVLTRMLMGLLVLGVLYDVDLYAEHRRRISPQRPVVREIITIERPDPPMCDFVSRRHPNGRVDRCV